MGSDMAVGRCDTLLFFILVVEAEAAAESALSSSCCIECIVSTSIGLTSGRPTPATAWLLSGEDMTMALLLASASSERLLGPDDEDDEEREDKDTFSDRDSSHADEVSTATDNVELTLV